MVLALGSGIGSASWRVPDRSQTTDLNLTSEQTSVREEVEPDGTCELVDANGVPLYDSQLAERTGSGPCAQD